jgi:hypothetical protein
MAIMGITADGDSLWSRIIELKGLVAARDVRKLTNGNLAVLGYALGADSVHSDIWLMECSPSGDILWTRSYGGAQRDTGTRLTQRDDGGLQICGNYASAGSAGQSDFWTQRTTIDGMPVGEAAIFGTEFDERAYDVIVNSTGDTYLCGTQNTGSAKGYVVKIPASGTGWERAYSVVGEGSREFHGLVPRLGGVMCVGWSSYFAGQSRPLITALDQNGDVEWSWNYGVDEAGSGFYGIIRVPSGGSLAFGAYRQSSTRYGFVMRIAPPGGVYGTVHDVVSGEPVPFARVSAEGVEGYAVSDLNGVYSLELLPGNYNLIVHGFCVDSSRYEGLTIAERQMTLLDLTAGVPRSSGSPTSVNMFARDNLSAIGYYDIVNEGSGTLYFSASADEVIPPGNWISVAPTSGSILPGHLLGLVVEVNADVSITGYWDYLGELRVTTNTCPDTARTVPVIITVLDQDGNRPAQIEKFELHSAFPNPFNSETSLRFDLPATVPVQMDLYNLKGQLVRTLLAGQLDAGSHSVSLALPDHPSGVYLVRLQAGNFSATQKIVLIK